MFSSSNAERSQMWLKKSNKDDELDLIADCLECLRQSTLLRPGLTVETRLELEESLAVAEAALRRAHLETKL